MPMQPPEKYRPQPNFRVLCPTHPGGTDPSNDNPSANPPLKRSTMDFGHWNAQRSNKLGRMATDIGSQTATVTVQYKPGDQVINPGECLLRIGEFELRPWVDYTPVTNNAINTAIAITAAINNLAGFTAVDDGAGVITISTMNALDRIPIEVLNLDYAHFVLTNDDGGYLRRVTSTGAVRHQTPDIT